MTSLEKHSFCSCPPDDSEQKIVILTEPGEIVIMALTQEVKKRLSLIRIQPDNRHRKTKYDSREKLKTILSIANYWLLLLLFSLTSSAFSL